VSVFHLVFFLNCFILVAYTHALKSQVRVGHLGSLLTVRSEPFFIVNFVLFLIDCVHNRLYCGQRAKCVLERVWRVCV